MHKDVIYLKITNIQLLSKLVILIELYRMHKCPNLNIADIQILLELIISTKLFKNPSGDSNLDFKLKFHCKLSLISITIMAFYSMYISILYFLSEIHKFIKCYSCTLKVHVGIGISNWYHSHVWFSLCIFYFLYLKCKVNILILYLTSEILKSIKCLLGAFKVHVKMDLSNWYYFHVWLSLYAHQHKWARCHKLLTCPIRLWQIFIMVHWD
jgi:hypothetical protein